MAVTQVVQNGLDTLQAGGGITETQNKFLGGLGVNAIELSQLTLGSKTIQEVIGAHTKEDLFNGFEAVDPQVSQLTDFLRTEPAMGDALYEAVVQNPSMLGGITELAQNGRLQQMGNMLASADPDSPLAGVAKQQVINTLRQIAKDPTKDVTLLTDLVDQAGGMNFMAFLDFFVDIMEGMPLGQAVEGLVADLGVTGDQADSVRHFMGSPFVGGIFEMTMGGTTARGGIYHEDSGLRQAFRETWKHAQNFPGISDLVGTTTGLYQTDVAATVTYDPKAFSSDFDAARTIDFSDGVQVAELNATLDQMAQLVPSASDELAAVKSLIQEEPGSIAHFNTAGSITKADLQARFEQMMKDFAAPDPATGTTSTPRQEYADLAR